MRTLLLIVLLAPSLLFADDMSDLVDLQRQQLEVQKEILRNQRWEDNDAQNQRTLEMLNKKDAYTESLERQIQLQNDVTSTIQVIDYWKEQERSE